MAALLLTPDVSLNGAPLLPENLRVYAVGDIHGYAAALASMHDMIREDLARYPFAGRAIEIYLGDYVDRGPDSRRTLDLLLEEPIGSKRICLMGNHEAILLQFLHDPFILNQWGAHGVWETLASYGLARTPLNDAARFHQLRDAFLNVLPDTHRLFLTSLPVRCALPPYGFVHAGIRPDIPLTGQSPDDLLWIREPFLSFEAAHSHFIVHGHTPVPEVEYHFNRLAVDTGIYSTGRLSCAVLERDTIRLLQVQVPV